MNPKERAGALPEKVDRLKKEARKFVYVGIAMLLQTSGSPGIPASVGDGDNVAQGKLAGVRKKIENCISRKIRW